jgi:UPF0271 protein
MLTIDINCDLGESFGAWTMGADESVMPNITSANIACGAHAGDPRVMRQTVRLAIEHDVGIGAHPGFADLQGFGRRDIRADPAEMEDVVLAQIGALAAIARAEGAAVRHVKAHGALYTMANRDRALAGAIARAIKSFDAALVMFALPKTPMEEAGREAGLPVALEGFADRSYEPDGSLTPRSRPGAVIHDPDAVVQRGIRMVRDRIVLTADGAGIPMTIDTICVHGDTPGAPELTRRLRRGLESAGIRVARPWQTANEPGHRREP